MLRRDGTRVMRFLERRRKEKTATFYGPPHNFAKKIPMRYNSRKTARMNSSPRIVAIVAAGGTGARAERAQPKQFAPVGGIPVVVRALKSFVGARKVDSVQVVVNSKHESSARKLLQENYLAPRTAPANFPTPPPNSRSSQANVGILTVGKETRAQTVAAAVCECCADDDWALVHDAARPFLDCGLLSRVIAAALRDGIGAAPLLPLSQALKKADDSGRIVESVPRAGLYLAQTPQMFRAGLLKKALALAPDADDECEAMHRAGHRFQSVPGDPRNIKLTFPADFALAEAMAAAEAREQEAA